MQQNDYILREIEKMGKILSVILSKMIKGKTSDIEDSTISEAEIGKLLGEDGGPDFDIILNSNENDLPEYLSGFHGINIQNLELLGDLIAKLGEQDRSEKKKIYLNRALFLYDLCNKKDKTYSFERESKIGAIRGEI